MQLLEHQPLLSLNTFGIEADARYYGEFASVEELLRLLDFKKTHDLPLLILGGGSNLLLTKDFEGLVIRNRIKGIEITGADSEHTYIRVGAGEVWHEFVTWCIEKGLAGLENMSLIPGSVGAAPMQNIGAYGVELKEVFDSLEAIHIESGSMHRFTKEECKFGYRESIFKTSHKNQYVITSVHFKARNTAKLNTSYGAIEDELKRMNITVPNIKDVSEAVCNIRRSKLPDPKVTGNAGSFFKNPEVKKSVHDELKARYPELVAYPLANGDMKLAAGWLIEQSGWKGKSIGNAGVHAKQALVLVNLGGAKGNDILRLSLEVKASVREKFGVELETEVNII